MRKIVKQIGNSKGITFSKEECITHNIKLDDILDVKINKLKKEQIIK